MTALSIRSMNFTLARREQQGEMATIQDNTEKVHYWWVERKALRGNTWSKVTEGFLTKSDAAKLWNKHFRNRTDRKYRLRHILTY